MPTDSTWEERRAESRTSGTPVLKGWEEKGPQKERFVTKWAGENTDSGRNRESSILRSREDFLERKDYNVHGLLEGENMEERVRLPAKNCLLD